MPEHGSPETLDRVRTPLLALITRESLDQDYEMVARRRGADHEPEPRPAGRVAVVAVVAVFGVLVAVAGVQTSRNAAATEASRESLIDRIENRQTAVGVDQARVAELRADNAEAEEVLLEVGDELSAVQSEQVQLELETGYSDVRGEGIRIVLDNAPYADPNSELRDADLALLINGLLQAGAEAISINNQRWAAGSAIYNVGPAIEVNSVGIEPPYTVLAIGDSSALPADLVNSESGLAFASLAQQYGFAYEIDDADDLRLPAAPARLRRLRSAEEDTGDDAGGGRIEEGAP
jgi:uncharacterized protein YlxW (UPF0749 family)